jgi:hypothetical protein
MQKVYSGSLLLSALATCGCASGLWTATSKGKTYLCSSFASSGVSSYSCASQAQ